MRLYDPNMKAEDKKEPPKLALAIGAFIGYAAAISLDAVIIWAILSFLVGLNFGFWQILGVVLIFNGLTAKFKK